MTLRDVMKAMLRQWYVAVVIVAAAGFLVSAYIRESGSYITDTVVIFTLPAKPLLDPFNGTGDVDVIAFAGAIAADIGADGAEGLYASSDAPAYGAGVRQGVSVGLRNTGGQWASSFATAAIEIQIVGRTEGWVQQQQRILLAKINNAVQVQQRVSPPKQHISANVEPLSTVISHVLPTRSSRLMAFISMGGAALHAAALASVAADDLAFRARQRHSARHGRRATFHSLGALR